MISEQQIEACVKTALPEVLDETFKDKSGKKHTWRSFWRGLTSEDHEDALQEMRVSAWRGFESHDPTIKDNAPATRGIACAKGTLKNWLRSQRLRGLREGRIEPIPHGFDIAQDSPDELDRLCTNDLAVMVAAASRFLPEGMARAIGLKFGLDDQKPKTHREVAELMGLSETKAWQLVRDGISRLRAEMRVDEILESSDASE